LRAILNLRNPPAAFSLIKGWRGPPSFTPRALAAARSGLGAHAHDATRHRIARAAAGSAARSAAGLIWFVTDLRGAKEHEIAAEHDVGLVFIDKDESAYLPITARGDVRRDWAEAAAIWKATDNMWWDGPDDPNAGVICGLHC
jgi:general stress protein 26